MTMLSTKKNPENNAPVQQKNPPAAATAPKTVAPEENDDLPF
jgi:single-strand DNA-binding protein